MTDDVEEKRSYPRIVVNVPVDLGIIDKPKGSSGLVMNASETGLMIQSFKDLSIGRIVRIEVLFLKDLQMMRFSAVAEIVWKDIYWWDDWEGYQYGLKFTQISNEDNSILKLLLSNLPKLKEISPMKRLTIDNR